MGNFDRFALNDEDIKTGIEDFFTQLLIEARRQKSGAKTLGDLSSNDPTVIYVVGQPGSGKTTLSRYVEKEYAKKGECTVEVNSDKIATYHRDYAELLKLLPDECYTVTRQFVKKAGPKIYDIVRDKRLNLIRESCFTKGERDYQDMLEWRNAGYGIELDILAVDKYESFLSCIERDIKLLELGFAPRPVARVNHDRMYEPLLGELIEIDRRGLSTKQNVFVRGKSLAHPELVWTTGDPKYPNAQEALVCERSNARRKLLQNPDQYLLRTSTAKHKIGLMIHDDVMQESYMTGLTQLEKEFLNELSAKGLE